MYASVGPTGDIGPTGDTGPTGPSGLKAFGQINTKTKTVEIPANVPTVVPLSDHGSKKNVDLDTVANSITVKEAGYYLLSYSVYPLFSATAPTDLTFAVRSNNVNIPQTVSLASAPATTFNASYLGSAIEPLPADAVIDIIVNSTSNISMSFDTSTISSLILYKID